MSTESQITLEFLKKATIRQKYILVISHEVTHLFMSPSPMLPWFQESAAMTIGKHIAISIDSSLADAFPDPIKEVDTKELFKYTYDNMINSFDTCKALQYKSYCLTHDLPVDRLVEWVEVLRDNMEYDDEQIYNLLFK